MGWWKKLFSGEEKVVKAVERSIRVAMNPIHKILFQRKIDENNEEERVGNISKSGMGLLYRPQLEYLSPGNFLEGELQIDRNGFEVKAEVVHITKSLLGCRFVGEFVDMNMALQAYLKGEILGLTLAAVNRESLAKSSEGTPEWYTDGDNNELYFVKTPEGIKHFHITFFGSYFEGGYDQKLRFGHIVDDGEREGVSYKGSNLVHFDAEVPAGTEELAATIIENISDLSLQNRNRILKLLGLSK